MLSEAQEVVGLARALNDQARRGGGGLFALEPEVLEGEGAESIIRKLALTARGNLNPMAAMFGGIVGQEVRRMNSSSVLLLVKWSRLFP